MDSASYEQPTHQYTSDEASPTTNVQPHVSLPADRLSQYFSSSSNAVSRDAFKSHWSSGSSSSEQPSFSGTDSTLLAAAKSSQLVIPSSLNHPQQFQLPMSAFPPAVHTEYLTNVSPTLEELSQPQATNQFENMPARLAESSKSIVKLDPLPGSVQRHSTDIHQASFTQISPQHTVNSVKDTQLPTSTGLNAASAPYSATYQPAIISLGNQLLQPPSQVDVSLGSGLETQNNLLSSVSNNDATAYSSPQLMQSSFSAFHPFSPIHQMLSFIDSHQATSTNTNSTSSSFLQSTSDFLNSEVLYTNSMPQAVTAESGDSTTTSAGEKRNVPIDLSNPIQDGVLSKRTKFEGNQ